MIFNCPNCQAEFSAVPEMGVYFSEQYLECPECGAEFVYHAKRKEVLDEFDDEEEGGEEFGLPGSKG